MRMSCNGCRVLRKGCCDDCTIRPCLQWIKSPDSQANATLFLAKFYGRAGLINLIEAGPPHLRPGILHFPSFFRANKTPLIVLCIDKMHAALFKSLLYEACGRIVNPVYGSVGLLWSGNWAQCQAAVDAVLKGSPIMQVPLPPPLPPSSSPSCFDQMPTSPPLSVSPLKTCDIRHVSKDPNPPELNRFRNRTHSKRSIHERLPRQHRSEDRSREEESMFSVETMEGSLEINRSETGHAWMSSGLVGVSPEHDGDDGLALDLTLSLVPV